MEGEGSMLVKQESTYKSVFILARNARRNFQGHLFEVKIGQGSEDIMGAREGIPVPIDAQDRPPLLHPVTKFFDDEKSHTVFPYNSSLVAVTFNGPSKLYMMVTAPEPKPYLIRSTKLKPKARVFDTETKSFYKFKRPKSFGERANLIPAYGKLYHLGRCGLKEGPAFERYDPCNDCWEPLPHVPAELFRGLGMLTGYAVYGDNILVSFMPISSKPYKNTVFAFHVIENKWHPVSGAVHIRGRAVVVGDSIYALTTSLAMVKLSFDSSTYSISRKQFLSGLESVRRYAMGERFDRYSEYMVHLGNLEFCRVCTAFDHCGGGRQPIWITTFQIVDTQGGNHIKTLHSAVFDVDLTNYYIYYSFNPDCEDNEPKGEETKGRQEKRCKRKRDCTE
ncbi:hypothetical protein ACE6H2_026185 [Prunus campanulata]